MSKWILDDKQVTNIIASKVVGEHARHQYVTKPTEWPNFTRSSVLYGPISKQAAKTLPPILVEVQHTANMGLLRRLIKYALCVRDQHSVLPIVVAMCNHHTAKDLLDMTAECEAMPFMKQLPCQGWAQSCYLLNAETISDHLQQIPLDPLVALAHFFIEQQPSLIHMQQRDDETLRLLYSIAERVFEKENALEQENDVALEEVCSETYAQLNMAKQTLMEDIPDEAPRKRTIDCLNNGMRLIDELRRKQRISSSSPDTTSQPTTTSHGQRLNHDWQFVDTYRQEKGKDMDWVKCFKLAKQNGLFKTYTNMGSAKASYFRAKKLLK